MLVTGESKWPSEKSQLVQPVRRELVQVAHVDFMLQKTRIRPRAGQHGAPHSLILHRAMFVGIADPELVSIREVVEDPCRNRRSDASGWERFASGVNPSRFGGAIAQCPRSPAGRPDPRRAPAENWCACCGPMRPGHRAFVILAALRWLDQRKGIGRVENGIAKHEN